LDCVPEQGDPVIETVLIVAPRDPIDAERFKSMKLSVSNSGVMWCISAVNRRFLSLPAASRTLSISVDALVRL
jgi:hypothetical protein